MTYENTINFSGDSRRAMQVAIDALIANGFRTGSKTESSLSCTGPGMNSTSQNPLRGISNAQITVSGNTISIRAELGSVKFMITFLIALMVSMSLLFLMVFGMTPLHSKTTPTRMPAFLLPSAVGLVLVPFLGIMMKRRTTRAVDALLHNMAALSVDGPIQ